MEKNIEPRQGKPYWGQLGLWVFLCLPFATMTVCIQQEPADFAWWKLADKLG